MMEVIIIISVLAATIPVGFFNPAPLDDITINLNLNESPRGRRNDGYHLEEEKDSNTHVDQDTQLSVQERSCGLTQLSNCGLTFADAVAKCMANPGAIIECVKDVIAEDSCIDCIFAIIQLAGGDIKCFGEEEKEDTDTRVTQVREKIIKESRDLMALGKSRQISVQDRFCGLPQIGNCGLKFGDAVLKCMAHPGAIIECVKEVIADDSCIDCIIELIQLAGGDIKCSGEEEEEDSNNRVAQVREKILKESKKLMAFGKSQQLSAQEGSCDLLQLGSCGLKFVDALAKCIVNPGEIKILECFKDVIGDDNCIDCVCKLIQMVLPIRCSGEEEEDTDARVAQGTSKKCWSNDAQSTDQWCTENCLHIPPNCPVDMCKCQEAMWSTWSEWSSCSESCAYEYAYIFRTRTCSIPGKCPGHKGQTKECDIPSCVPIV